MAFPGNSETGLLVSLQKAVAEKSGWTEFLAGLAAMANARFAAMIVEIPGSSDAAYIVNAMPNGQPLSISSDALGTILSDRLRPERIYSAAELKDIDSGAEMGAALDKLGTTAVRAMRIVVSESLSITVGIFGSVEFGAADGAILRRLFPYLKSCTRAAVIVERERYRASVSASLARKTGLGWFLLDRSGVIVGASPDRPDRLPGFRIFSGLQGERLAFADRATETALADILDRCARGTAERSAAIGISSVPMLHMRISPFSTSDFAWHCNPVACVTLHGESQMTADSSGLLADLFGLLPSEARLAKALASGRSLAEAAEQMGLTIETVRNYSKKIFAKTGTRGQADLVRYILANGLAELEDPSFYDSGSDG
ncbi:helix-turn-helix transcriptional regulator [Parasphingorhabdus sp.]|uniref:helix-turn-helix transcriptional regulator n=1 Tax=Parasphingorhabdus sp. TaxID=2709688 RepID=UPI00300308B1